MTGGHWFSFSPNGLESVDGRAGGRELMRNTLSPFAAVPNEMPLAINSPAVPEEFLRG